MGGAIRKIVKNVVKVCCQCPYVTTCSSISGAACIYAGGTIDPNKEDKAKD